MVSSIPGRYITNNRGGVTKSEGAILHEVNNLPFIEYLTGAGMEITKESIKAISLMMYYADSPEPVALGLYAMFDDGSVLTGGPTPVGTQFTLGSIDSSGIMESAEIVLKRISERENRQAALILPCMMRYIMLAPNQDSELRLIEEKMRDRANPVMMGYSGGEICPVRGEDGKPRNRFHNYTFCACIL
jgi:hypothetical protein